VASWSLVTLRLSGYRGPSDIPFCSYYSSRTLLTSWCWRQGLGEFWKCLFQIRYHAVPDSIATLFKVADITVENVLYERFLK